MKMMCTCLVPYVVKETKTVFKPVLNYSYFVLCSLHLYLGTQNEARFPFVVVRVTLLLYLPPV